MSDDKDMRDNPYRKRKKQTFFHFNMRQAKVIKKVPGKPSGVRIDCYLSKLSWYQTQYPKVYFEVLSGIHKSPLAPPNALQQAYFWDRGRLIPGKFLANYFRDYAIYVAKSPKAKERLNVLREIACHNLVFLVGLARDPQFCVRSKLKEILDKMLQENRGN